MGRPEPCVLFSQSFVHPHLDEYVDEVLFSEPIVITACEFLEQNASSSCPTVTIVGATSPPSFALEVFVQCEGEPRFRRLCQPFLYSHSSSNVLEVEAVVTNHLVVRGSYRSLTLVVYGNTAEDLGQFNIEFDLDNSLANLVCSPSEGKLEDLPPALNLARLTFEESISSLKALSLPIVEPDLSVEMKQFLYLILKICSVSDHEDTVHNLASIIMPAVSSYVSSNFCGTTTTNEYKQGSSKNFKRETLGVLNKARDELLELLKLLQHASGDMPDELFGEAITLEFVADLPTSELLLDVFSYSFLFKRKSPIIEFTLPSQNENMIVGLSVVLLLCSARESCFHFVNGSGMDQLAQFFSHEAHRSTAVTLMLLGVIEHATRSAIGCEGFLGWWPREDENVPVGSSEGYSQLLKLLLQKQRHDVASLATYVLHRLRLYEIASRYESAVLCILGNLSAIGSITLSSVNSLMTANSQLKKLLKLLNLHGRIEDPSPASSATRSLILAQSEGLLSYGATIKLIASSKYCFSNRDIDTHLLWLLKERGFLPLSAALLSSPILRSETGHAMDIFVDITASIEAIILSLLFCRSGLVFLLLQPEVSATVILSLRGVEDVDKIECVPLRYAAVLISKGFICHIEEIGMITELHLRVVNAIDRLLTATPYSEELLWILWELCALSRSDSGRQAVLSLSHFPEAVVVLMEALRSIKELQPMASNNGASPLSLAIFHLASELFEIMVTDSTASSLFAWIGHAVELHKALHSSSPGSSRKDAPTRLLEWIDAGVVYHKNGAIGLLRYAAVLASGGDAHLTSTSILVSDSMDVEKVVGDSANGSDAQVVENLLGKLVSDKFFDGVTLRDSSIAQLTTTFRILAFISENSAVAASLYDEGAVTVIYVVLINCKFMLERSSNSYDYLVDEGAESNSTSDMLLERSRDQSLIDLMIPSLVLLITLLQKLQDAKEQHRNTKLLNALLQLHREVSPKLAACAADLSSPYPSSALGLGAVCRLIVSALACWPVFSWTPGLFHCLLESVQATSSLALGPKEACSLLCLLGDLFPEEGIWLWKNRMPQLSAVRSLGVATLLGPEREKDVDWYLKPGHISILLSRLTPLLDKIAQIILHFAFTALVVIQDMLRVFIIRIACQKVDSALVLLRPIISWIHDHVFKLSPLSDKDSFKVHRLLDFVASLLEHPRGKELLLREGAVGILIKVLQRCSYALDSDRKLISESRILAKSGASFLSWCFPVFKSLALICDPQSLHHSGVHEKPSFEKMGTGELSLIGCNLLKLCQVLPVGRELQACLAAFKELASSSAGRSALASIFEQIQSSSVEDVEAGRGKEGDGNSISDEYDWRRFPPLLMCWQNLLRSIDSKDGFLICAIEAVNTLCLSASCLCMEGENLEGILILKCLFGLPCNPNGTDDCPDGKLKDVHEMLALLDLSIGEDEYSMSTTVKTSLCQVKESVKSLLLLLQKPGGSVKMDNMTSSSNFSSSKGVLIPSKTFSVHSLMPSIITTHIMDEEAGFDFSRIIKSDGNAEKATSYLSLGGLADSFLWECPDSSPDRLSMQGPPLKRKMTSVEGSNRRLRGDSVGPESVGANAFSRGVGAPAASSGPTRRDTFRQRKPNTSRPPSMHVDDYVARERSVDGAGSGTNVVSTAPRGATGGRPPSIHVDEFMARQRERQNPMATAVGEAVQARNSPPENENDSDKFDRSRQLKADLDDDQEINIVFDEESESDDRLPFPQPDDNLLPAPVIVGESSPHSIVEESENDINESAQFSRLSTPPATKMDANSHSGGSLRRSVSGAEIQPMDRESSISSEKNYSRINSEKAFSEQAEETKHTALLPAFKVFDAKTTANSPVFPSQFYNKGPISSPVQPLGDSRLPRPAFYQKDNQQQPTNAPLASGSQGFYDQKLPVNQPPLPPLPPPPAVSPILSHTAEPIQTHSSPYGNSVRDVQPPLPAGYPFQALDVSGPSTIPSLHVREDRPASLLPSASSSQFSDSPNPPFQSQIHAEYQSTAAALLATPHPVLESKYSWATVSSAGRLHDEPSSSTGSGRPPPLPPMPPPYSASLVSQSSVKSSASQSPLYNQASVGIQLPLPSTPLSNLSLGAFSAATGSSLTSYPLPPLGPPPMASRPSIPGTLFGSGPMQQQGQNPSSLSIHPPNPQPSVQSLQPRPPLQPLQPPLLRPPQPPQHPRPSSIQVSQQQSEQVIPLRQSPIQVQLQPLPQIQQQLPISQIHVYYQAQQQEQPLQPHQLHVEHAQPHATHQQGETAPSQQQQDSGMTLQQYFSSPEAIQSLLSDREKLCQLLEQHPKLMQMLQEKLGQL